MEHENDEISLQGIEFWSTVCDEEVDCAIELSEVCCLCKNHQLMTCINICKNGWNDSV